MARRYWKRTRDQAVGRDCDARPAGANPWYDQAPPSLRDLGRTYGAEPTDAAAQADAADRTRDWADRLRQKQERRARPSEEDQPPTSAGYWTVEGLFEESRRLQHEEELHGPTGPADGRANPWRFRELLAVFDLEEGATSAEIGSAYRRLAKKHHPDRFVEADPDTQAFHAAEMRRIIDAYQALRSASV
jgi:DnaJ-domain-containing protein 1